jgi:hypothetical protein
MASNRNFELKLPPRLRDTLIRCWNAIALIQLNCLVGQTLSHTNLGVIRLSIAEDEVDLRHAGEAGLRFTLMQRKALSQGT